ncbi:hypothetical protein X559_1829 [Paenilisteria newyorkensis]|nr:hypothetical protein X559_1829 [Listeria newyorkensis]
MRFFIVLRILVWFVKFVSGEIRRDSVTARGQPISFDWSGDDQKKFFSLGT